jgi:ribosomal protein S20
LAKNKDYHKEEKDGEVAKLKRHIRHLEKENTRIKSELRTYEKAFFKNITFLKEKTKNLSLEDLLKGAEEELNLQQIKEEKVQDFAQMQKKWACYTCEVGVMKLIIVPSIGGGSRYFRKCSNPKCKHRTDVKEYTEEVEGVK